MTDLDDIEKAIGALNRQVDELAVRKADQLVAFGKLRAEKGALLSDLTALHRENFAAAGRMRARLDNIATAYMRSVALSHRQPEISGLLSFHHLRADSPQNAFFGRHSRRRHGVRRARDRADARNAVDAVLATLDESSDGSDPRLCQRAEFIVVHRKEGRSNALREAAQIDRRSCRRRRFCVFDDRVDAVTVQFVDSRGVRPIRIELVEKLDTRRRRLEMWIRPTAATAEDDRKRPADDLLGEIQCP